MEHVQTGLLAKRNSENKTARESKRLCSTDIGTMSEQKPCVVIETSDAVMTTELNICDLPDSILLKIFKYLQYKELLLNVAITCQRFHFLTKDPHLWRYINLQGLLKVTDKTLAHITSISSNVLSVNLTDSKFITDEGVMQMTSRCPHLQRLKLVRCLEISAVGMAAISQNCRYLQFLNLDCCTRLTDDALSQIGNGCTILETLYLDQCLQITDKGIANVARGCNKIKVLSIGQLPQLTDCSLEAITEHCPDMERFNCMSSGFSAVGLSTCIGRWMKLHFLEVSDMEVVSNDVVKAIVCSSPSITDLNLSLCRNVTDVGVKSIVRHLPNLKKCFMVACQITDASLIAFANSCKKLVSVDFGWCADITDVGAQAVCDSLPNLSHVGLVRCDKMTLKKSLELCENFPLVHVSNLWLDLQRLMQAYQNKDKANRKMEMCSECHHQMGMVDMSAFTEYLAAEERGMKPRSC